MPPQFHFAPARGWLNDPNGLIHYRGRHHLFFQHNPDRLVMEDMEWGHASSTDLVHWTEHPVALRPGSDGDYDADGCWSGCAMDTGDGVTLVYSGNRNGVQLPCIATSTDDDLIHWTKARGNPVIDRRPPVDDITDMRDHSVRRDGDRWRQVLAAGAGGKGMLFGFSSEDLNWSWDGVVLHADQAGLPGFGWECPDVFSLSGHAVAIFSIMDHDRHPAVVWAVGHFEGPRIVPERTGLLDVGDRLYAPQSYTDAAGRRLMFGWLKTQDDPAAHGGPSIGLISLPRRLRVVDGTLHQAPAEDLHTFRGGSTVAVLPAGQDTVEVAGGAAAAVEVRIECRPAETLAGLEVELTRADGRSLRVDLGSFRQTPPYTGDLATEQAPVAGGATLIFDAGVVEVFLDDGRAGVRTDMGLESVSTIRLVRSAGDVTLTQWPLA